ncbi:hypothetical protein MMC28_010456 [Mycoblastus sanguinarius]|nr:hypothetical protein [Mycoblastus sanguinarius]
MAYRQPTFTPASRQLAAQEPDSKAATTLPSQQRSGIEESHEWVLFPDQSDAQTHTASIERTPRTAGLSRLSDFGSLETAAKSRETEGIQCEATDGSVEDDEELDSLDEGLHAFQEPSVEQRSGYFDQSGSILPRHDGLGTFAASSTPVQEHLWHFEQYNRGKRSIGHRRRRSSAQRRFDPVEENEAVSIGEERRERIEKWRMDQSRLLLDEIERETRRRRTSLADKRVERTPSTAGLEQIIREAIDVNTGDREPQQATEAEKPEAEDSDSFWQRITRRVIRDIIGIDDATLSVIFGESLPTEKPSSSPSVGLSTSRAPRVDDSISVPSNASWEARLLGRLARELGFLVQHLSDHPGAFTAPFNPSTSDYAGMPVTVPTSSKTQPKLPPITKNAVTSLSPSFAFEPTLRDSALQTPTSTADSTHAALWGIEEEPSSDHQEGNREYWEQTPDVKTVFRFLHNHLTSNRRPPPTLYAVRLLFGNIILSYHELPQHGNQDMGMRDGTAFYAEEVGAAAQVVSSVARGGVLA